MNDAISIDRLLDDMSIAARATRAIFTRGTGTNGRTRDKVTENKLRAEVGDEGQIVTRKLFTSKSSPIFKRNQLMSEAYAYHNSKTTEGFLPNALLLEYTQQMATFESQADKLHQEIIDTYDQIVADDIVLRNAALTAQGKTPSASVDDYPTIDKMRSYLYMNWRLEPIATENDFRFEVPDTIKQRLVQRDEDIKSDITNDLMQRLMKPMKHFVEKLAVPIGEDGAKFHNSLVGNLNELLVTLPALNIYNDPRVDALLKDVEVIIKPYVFSPDVLREVPEARDAASNKMKELLKQFDGYGF